MVQIFLSYAHADTERLDAFLTHLGPVRRAQGLTIWDDRRLRAGEMWDEGIRKAVRDSDIFICLVTNRFLDSHYIRDTELPAILQAAKGRGALVIPVILEKSHWRDEFAERQCVPLTKRGELRPIVNWRPRNDGFHEASVQIARSITDYIEKEPPRPPSPGPSLIATPDGFEITDDTPSPAERRDPMQQALLAALQARLARFDAPVRQSCGNSHPVICQEFDAYRSFADADIDSLNIGALVAAGNALSGMVKRLAPPLPEGVMTEPLEPEILAGLEAILSEHARLIMGFAEGRELVHRVAVFNAAIEQPAKRAAEVRDVLKPMCETTGLLAPQARQLIAAMEASISVASVRGMESLGEAIHTGGRFVGDVARVIGRKCGGVSGFVTLAGFGAVMAGDPNFEAYRAALAFLIDNARAVSAFASGQDEFRRVLQWALERVGQTPQPKLGDEDGEDPAGRETLGDEPPADFDMDEVKRMILAGLPPPERWVPWITELNLAFKRELTDLAPLAGLHSLRSLRCSGTHVSDLTPLADLQSLRSLDCSQTLVDSVMPLANLKNLRSLNCGGTEVHDLTSLSNLQSLQILKCWDTQVGDLSPLANLQSLRSLNCRNTQISDLTPIANLQSLRFLNCRETQISDLAPIALIPTLQALDCSRTSVRDLWPVANLQSLRFLKCWDTPLSDLMPLASLQNLQSLKFWETQVSDLTPLAGLNSLQSLNCARTRISNLGPLAGLQALQSLDCSGTQVTDLTPLADLQSLQSLNCSQTRISEIGPLAGLQNLQSLDCSGAQVSDLTSIVALTGLQSLALANCSLNLVTLSLPSSLSELVLLDATWPDDRPLPNVPHRIDPDGTIHDGDRNRSNWFELWAKVVRQRQS